jgi:hypothetical protein
MHTPLFITSFPLFLLTADVTLKRGVQSVVCDLTGPPAPRPILAAAANPPGPDQSYGMHVTGTRSRETSVYVPKYQ